MYCGGLGENRSEELQRARAKNPQAGASLACGSDTKPTDTQGNGCMIITSGKISSVDLDKQGGMYCDREDHYEYDLYGRGWNWVQTSS
jgi:hypothetical protein